jgi:uncharacterized protein (UPF0333 family)
MKQKGQVFSLDFVVSIVLLVIVLSLAMQFLELKEVEAKEFLVQSELDAVGNTAAELLVNNPSLSCKLTNYTGTEEYGVLSNCIRETSPTITKIELGISSSYNCLISTSPSINFVTECTGNPVNAENVFSVARKIVVLPSGDKLPKNYLYNCIKGDSCVLVPTEVTIKVWKT